MKKITIIIILLLFSSINIFAQAIKVEVTQINGEWTLVREGKPYYINGAGGNVYLDELVEAGGNSIRIWSSEDAGDILDKAQEKGLTVMFGLWVQHERHGFDYNNEDAVKAQLEFFKEIVTKYKDHPALLLWAVGNEVDLMYTNYKVWDAVQDIAHMIHQIDPNHPVTTVTAGLHEKDLKLIIDKCPDIDIYSVNTYGEICTVKENIKKYGWSGPYIIAEWGPTGHWEVNKTKWMAPVEQSSHEKALAYYERYNSCILGDKEHCIGSYVFLWGQKQETTSTWYGVFTKDGKYSEIIDYLTKSWKGEWPANRAPSLDSVLLNNMKKGDDIYLIAENTYDALVFTTDDKNKVKITWEVIPESDDIKAGGDAESEPVAIAGLIKKQSKNKLIFRAPKNEGAYRLFVTVTDSDGKVAYANIPFYVNPRDKDMQQSRAIQFKTRTLDITE